MKKVWIFSLIVLFAFVTNDLFAEDNNSVNLEPLVITPGRSQETINNSPANIAILTGAQIERSKAKSIPELLNMQGSVMMRDYIGNGKSTDADIHGYGETGLSNVLVLIDGRRVNNIDLSGTDWIQIPVSTVERIEILKGAGTVLYGDNATGGVVNIITKEPSKKDREFKMGLTIGSYETYSENGEFSVKKGPFSVLGNFEQYRTDGYRINSDLIRNDFNGKMIYSLTDNTKAKFTFADHTDKYGLPGALTDIRLNTRNRRASVTPDDFARTRDVYFDLGLEQNMDASGNLEFATSKRKRDTFSNFVGSGWMTERDTKTYATNLKYLLDNKLFGHKNKLISGIDYFDAEQDVVDGGIAGNPDKLTLSRRNFGFYLNDNFNITEDISVSGGYRHEKVRYNFEQEAALRASQGRRFKEDVFSAAFNYSYMENSNIYFNFQDSFRDPLIDEVYITMFDFGFGPGGGLNTGLGPQTAKNYEAGIRHSFNKKIIMALNGYFSKVHNEIYYEPTTGNNTNYEHTIHRGAELNSDVKVNDNIKISGNFTFTDSFFYEGIYDNKQIPAVPYYKWSAGSELKLNPSLRFTLFANYVGERYFISDQTNQLPRMASYITLDSKLIYDKNNFSLFLSVNNLLNEKYYEYGVANFTRTVKNYYPAAGTNVSVGGSVKF